MRKTCVLVVEDESIIAMDIQSNLIDLGYEVVGVVSRGEEAIKIAATKKVDIVLMDIVLAGEKSGVETAHLIHSQSNIPIIYMTGNADVATIKEARQTEPFGYIHKPINMQDMFSTIDSALHHHKLENQLKEKREALESTNEELNAAMEELESINEELGTALNDIQAKTDALEKSEYQFKALFESMTEGVAIHKLIYDNDGSAIDYCILNANSAFEKHTGLDVHNAYAVAASEYYGITPPPFFDTYTHVAKTGVPTSFQSYYAPLDRHFSITVFSPGKDLFVTVFEDITTRKIAEEALRKKSIFLETLINTIPSPVFYKDTEGIYRECNSAFANYIGQKRDKIIGTSAYEIAPREFADTYTQMDKKVFQDKVQAYETTIRHADKSIHDVVIYKAVVTDDNSKNMGIVGVILDITERKKSELKLKSSLLEKEILIKEIHHRIKNNFQIITSMLNLHARKTKKVNCEEVFKDVASRIRSMALTHEKLYHSENFSKIDFADYVTTLTQNLYHTYWKYSTEAEIIIKIDPLEIGIDQAIPCGLIINEILTNTFKHAFPEDRKDNASVKLEMKNSDGNITLRIADNGIGIQKNYISQPEELGLPMVKLLTEQIKGTSHIEHKNGTMFELTFKEKPS